MHTIVTITAYKAFKAEFSRRNNVHNAKFSVETRLEHGFAIEYTYFHDYSSLHTIVPITANRAL